MAVGPITGRSTSVAGTAGLRAPRRSAGQGGFTLPPELGEASTIVESTGVAATSLSTLLALQEVDTPTEQDRKAHRHAEILLDELQALQLEMLGRPPDSGRLHRLAGMIHGLPVATHLGLRAAVAAVAMRAELELARPTMSRQLLSISLRE